MSEAVELYKKDGSTAGIFFCSECRIVFRTEDEAKLCHGDRICECGEKVTDRFRAKCGKCLNEEWRKQSVEREFQRYKAAKVIPYAEYNGGMIYADDRYFEDLESLQDHYFDNPLPEYAWACKDMGIPALQVDDVLSNIIDNMWEDADSNDLNGVVELDTALREFNKANEGVHVWEPDYSIAILLSKEEPPHAD